MESSELFTQILFPQNIFAKTMYAVPCPKINLISISHKICNGAYGLCIYRQNVVHNYVFIHIEGLVQDCSNSIANALELLQSSSSLALSLRYKTILTPSK